MIPISIDELLERMSKENSALNKQDMKNRILFFAERKKKGVRCLCGQSIWAIGSALSGFDMCFQCLMGEEDNTQDFELDIVCETNS
ncbi:hypothetical protein IM538_12020 [Cytobacillus suaedae]|nr:hypothetical protein IM538_12020 [Cytobacillus suaedae]